MKKWLMIVLAGMSLAFVGKEMYAQSNPLMSEFKTPYQVPPFDKINEGHFIPAIRNAVSAQDLVIEEIINESNPSFENTYVKLEASIRKLNDLYSIFSNLSAANTNPEMQRIARELAPIMAEQSDKIYLNTALYKKLVSLGAGSSTGAAAEAATDDAMSGVLSAIEEVKRMKETSDDPYLDEKLAVLQNEIGQVEEAQGVKNHEKFISELPQGQKVLGEEILKRFVRAGANLPESQKERLKEINGRLALLSVEFGENVLNDINEYKLVITDKKDLAGLPPNVVEAAKQRAADEKIKGWVFTLSLPSMEPFLAYADNRDLRQEIMEAHLSKGDSHKSRKNAPIITEMVELRHEKANMLGYRTHAHYVLSESMARTPDNVMDLLNQIWTPALKMVQKEADAIQKMIQKDGHDFKLEPWDWAYYTEKIRKEKYDLDAEELRPYFELENVKAGMFDVIERLWGLKFKALSGMPKYHQDVQVYEVTEANGNHLGVLYMDFHPRAGKRGGAWMSSFRKQYYDNGKRVAPVITIVCNFTSPTKKDPSLLTLREVETLYHEMGHALHGLLSDVEYHMLSGTSVPRDFVELPSQIMENWATDRSLLQKNAKHYKTNAPIPTALLDKIEASSKFNMGFKSVEYLAASFLDMRYHAEPSAVGARPDMVEFMVTARQKLPSYIPFRYRSTYFNHIFSGGYSSGYYSYIWSEVLDADAFMAFEESGDIFNKQLAKKFREQILEKGGTLPAHVMYKNFRGSDPDIKALLKRRGFL